MSILLQKIMIRVRSDIAAAVAGRLNLAEIEALAGLGTEGRHVQHISTELHNKMAILPLTRSLAQYPILLRDHR